MSKLALALFPFNGYLSSDLLGTLTLIKEMGYEGVEFAGGFSHDVDELVDALKRTGLEVVGWHVQKHYLNNEFLQSTIHYMQTLQNGRLIIPNLPPDDTNTTDAWARTAGEFNELSRKLSHYGMRIGYHNHQEEFRRTDHGYLFDTFCSSIDEDVIIQLDVGNMLSAGACPESFLKKYPNHFNTVHIKPYSLESGFNTVLGEDSLNYSSIIKICQETAGTEWFIIEYESQLLFNSFEGAENCLSNFKKILMSI
ncbi:sugar phosphate isomerase/epimerase family protein [Paenibacillus riograndensis]|uniref:sugar phosphate isomerase/epimerase family protein n=1 Tax=Paenibacillus riograndensis TaxID=483937 RepID=UPI000763D83B|nr:TIM barrel protein [Paenibacillus riograndensis]